MRRYILAIVFFLLMAASALAEGSWICPNCGDENTTKFCGGCGEKKPENTTWICPNCGRENSTNFCGDCGTKRVEGPWTCPSCGRTNTTNFCENCGRKKPGGSPGSTYASTVNPRTTATPKPTTKPTTKPTAKPTPKPTKKPTPSPKPTETPKPTPKIIKDNYLNWEDLKISITQKKPYAFDNDCSIRLYTRVENRTGKVLWIYIESAYVDGIEVNGVGMYTVPTGYSSDLFFKLEGKVWDQVNALMDAKVATITFSIREKDSRQELYKKTESIWIGDTPSFTPKPAFQNTHKSINDKILDLSDLKVYLREFTTAVTSDVSIITCYVWTENNTGKDLVIRISEASIDGVKIEGSSSMKIPVGECAGQCFYLTGKTSSQMNAIAYAREATVTFLVKEDREELYRKTTTFSLTSVPTLTPHPDAKAAQTKTSKPTSKPTPKPTSKAATRSTIYGRATQKLAINSGPGTRRYFNEIGTYDYSGQWVEIAAKCWDPNNDIWWVKVKYSGGYGWTGLKRFDTSTFSLSDVPEEYWYSGKGQPTRRY